MITCVCCGRWRLERVLRDESHATGRQRGARPAGVSVIWRLHHRRDDGVWVRWADHDTVDEAAAELERRGVRMWE